MTRRPPEAASRAERSAAAGGAGARRWWTGSAACVRPGAPSRSCSTTGGSAAAAAPRSPQRDRVHAWYACRGDRPRTRPGAASAAARRRAGRGTLRAGQSGRRVRAPRGAAAVDRRRAWPGSARRVYRPRELRARPERAVRAGGPGESSANAVLFPFGSPNATGVGSLCFVSYGMIAPGSCFGTFYRDLEEDLDDADLALVWGATPPPRRRR